MSSQLGLLLALGSAFVSNLGFLWRQRGAVQAPDVTIAKPVRSVVGLFSAKWWTIGFVAAIVAWLLHVGSLSLASLSMVQAVLAGGFVFLAVLAERFFGFQLGKREWVGLLLTAAGLAFIALTAGDTGKSTDYKLWAMIAFQAGLVVVGTLLVVSPGSRGAQGSRRGVLLGAAAGLLFTVTHVSIKALTGMADNGVLQMVLSPAFLLVIAGGVAAFFTSARSLQIGEAVPVIAVTNVAGNLSAIAAGVFVFGDPVGESPLLVAARLAAFALVIVAGAVIPGPVRAARAAQEDGEQEAGAAEPEPEPTAPDISAGRSRAAASA
jgi:drug/metabolite transporter (DMT)-like permease